jgi:TRAP transporter TAXI family solute receptor
MDVTTNREERRLTGPLPNRRVLLAALAGGLVAPSAVAQGRSRLLLLSGSAGGVFAEYGPALASVLGKAGIEADVQQTGGSNDNIRALGRGEADLGLVNMGPAYDAWEGRRPFEGDGPQKSLRALFAMYETPFSLVTLRSSGITKLADLKGRIVGVGPAGGPGEIFFKGLTKELGIETRIATGSASELARRVLAGEVDAFWFGAGLPVGAFVQVLYKGEGLVFGLTPEEVAAFRRAFAYFAPYEIPAGTYKGQSSPLTTAAVWNFVLASERLAEDVAYAVTRAALGQAGAIRAAVPAASGTTAANALTNGFLPFHPGAVRYYREAGVTLPPALTAG